MTSAGSEKQKMIAGELYFAAHPELMADRVHARRICQAFNQADPLDADAQGALVQRLIKSGANAFITPPFFCDYGYNITLAANAYFNFNCVILDVMPVVIGANSLFGPGVHIYTATHPIDAAERRAGLELAKPVTIGDDVWVGGGTVICPGVTIGDRAVIGAGSVVTRSIPADVFAAGNPCRVVRALDRKPGTAEPL